MNCRCMYLTIAAILNLITRTMIDNNTVPAFRFIYKIRDCDNSILDGISLDFRENSREEADIRAEAEASKFGIYAYAKFVKEL